MFGFGAINQQRNHALQQKVNQTLDDCQINGKEVDSLIDAAKQDGVVEQSEINTLNDLFVRSRPKTPGHLLGRPGAMPGAGAMAPGPKQARPGGAQLGGMGMMGAAGAMLGAPADVDATPEARQKLNDFLAQAQNDVKTDNPATAFLGKIRANTMPTVPYRQNMGFNGPVQNDPGQFRFDHARLESELNNAGTLCKLQDLPGVSSAEVNSDPKRREGFEHARVEVGFANDSQAPSHFTLSRIAKTLGNVPFITKLKQQPLDATLNKQSDWGMPSLKDKIMALPDVDHIRFDTDSQGFSKPVVVFSRPVSQQAKTQLTNMMHEAHLAFSMDINGVFDCD